MGTVATDALRPGAVLSGRIRIERMIGQGSMGVVLEATDMQLQRRVAVKLMSPNRVNDDEAKKRFLREARAAVRLSSEHVTRLLDVGELDDGTPYLVMEYLVGATLEQVIVRDGVPPVDVAIDWVLQALDGVAEAHREGFVHRDLKPENLFLCEAPNRLPIVKVLDFGTVKDLVSKGTQLTRSGSTMGSPAYMPPEQVRADAVDQRADVWAMGVTLYELLTGMLPFGGASVPQTLTAILRDEPIPLRQLRPEAPVELEAIVACALCKDPSGRYPSGAELLEALSAVRAKLPRTSNMTRTVHISPSSPLKAVRPDAFADTTDMRTIAAADSSRIRPRVIINESAQSAKETVADLRPSSHVWTIAVAALGAIVAGGLGGAYVSRRQTPTPITVISAPAPKAITSTDRAPVVVSVASTAAPLPPPSASPSASARPPGGAARRGH